MGPNSERDNRDFVINFNEAMISHLVLIPYLFITYLKYLGQVKVFLHFLTDRTEIILILKYFETLD